MFKAGRYIPDYINLAKDLGDNPFPVIFNALKYLPSKSCWILEGWDFETKKRVQRASPNAKLPKPKPLSSARPGHESDHIYPLVTNIAMENPQNIYGNFQKGKPSISIRAIEKPWRTVNVITRGYIYIYLHLCSWYSELGDCVCKSRIFRPTI